MIIESITAIVVALIGASHLWDRRRTKRVEQKQDVVVNGQANLHNVVVQLLSEHMRQDDENFAALRKEMASLR